MCCIYVEGRGVTDCGKIGMDTGTGPTLGPHAICFSLHNCITFSTLYPEAGGSTLVQNIGRHQPGYTTSQSIRRYSWVFLVSPGTFWVVPQLDHDCFVSIVPMK
jgi:hypothetical protein